jgi:hypothetical protein
VRRQNTYYYYHSVSKIDEIENNFSEKHPTLWKNVLTEIDNNDIEESKTTVTTPCYSSCYYCDYKPDSKDDYERHVG